MARYRTRIESRLSQAEAFAYLADFSNARFWDPSVSEARRDGDAFELVSRFAGRDVPLRYTVAELDAPNRVVLQAERPSFTSRDTITCSPTANGCVVEYDARLVFTGVGRLLDPLFQLVFNRVGAKATGGLRRALNP